MSSTRGKVLADLADVVRASKSATDRFALWVDLVRAANARDVLEVGVYRGEFSERLLRGCDSVARYYLLDPWRHLNDWNKPANEDDRAFEEYLAETLTRTAFASHKIVVLRGRTTEVIDRIADDSLDFAYIDGDHTLRGIAVDLIRTYPKLRDGGWLAGDDFCPTVWQHATTFEPTLVFPFAVYFAEAMGARILALPFSQFLIEKRSGSRFEFVDTTGAYPDGTLRSQFTPDVVVKQLIRERLPRAAGLVARARRLLGR